MTRTGGSFGSILWGLGFERRSARKLDLRFDPGDGTLPGNISFTRASTATRFDSAGVLQTTASGTARVDSHVYDGTNWINRGLLIEEARTNLFLRSEEFSNVAWAKTRSTVTGDATVAPNGTTTADKLVEDNTAANNHYITIYISVVSGVSYTFSSFAKKADYDRINFQISTTRFPATVKGTFNLVTGVIDETTGSPDASSITDVGGGWFRCSLTATADSTGSNPFFIVLDEGTGGAEDTTIDGDGTSGTFIWGAQLEAEAFPTSYIKTTTAAVTRAADVATISDVTWLNQSAGTFLFEWTPSSLTSFRYVASIQDADDDIDESYIFYTSGNNVITQVAVGGVAQATLTHATATTLDQTSKRVDAVAVNDAASSVDGGAVQMDTPAALPTITRMIIGNRSDGARALNGYIYRITYWNRRLSDGHLQSLTA